MRRFVPDAARSARGGSPAPAPSQSQVARPSSAPVSWRCCRTWPRAAEITAAWFAATATATARDARGVRLCPGRSCFTDVEALGERGAVVDVSAGYLRNYLVPRKLADRRPKASIKAAERREQDAERARAEAEERSREKRGAARRTVLTIPQQAGDDGRLFGLVTPRHRRRDPGRPRIRSTAGRPPGGADSQRRHVHGRGGNERRRYGDGQDHGGAAAPSRKLMARIFDYARADCGVAGAAARAGARPSAEWLRWARLPTGRAAGADVVVAGGRDRTRGTTGGEIDAGVRRRVPEHDV